MIIVVFDISFKIINFVNEQLDHIKVGGSLSWAKLWRASFFNIGLIFYEIFQSFVGEASTNLPKEVNEIADNASSTSSVLGSFAPSSASSDTRRLSELHNLPKVCFSANLSSLNHYFFNCICKINNLAHMICTTSSNKD